MNILYFQFTHFSNLLFQRDKDRFYKLLDQTEFDGRFFPTETLEKEKNDLIRREHKKLKEN
jgi:hypothetical protein